MTGSALAMDVVLALVLGENLLNRGGSLREGGWKIPPEGRLADFLGGGFP